MQIISNQEYLTALIGKAHQELINRMKKKKQVKSPKAKKASPKMMMKPMMKMGKEMKKGKC